MTCLITRLAPLAAAGALASGAHAQTVSSTTPESLQGDWVFGLTASFVSADLEILSTELILPDGVQLENATLDLTEVSVSSTMATSTASYFLLPFLEVHGLLGVTSTSSESDLLLTAQPDFGLGLVEDPVTIGLTSEADLSGIAYGAGAGLYLPVAMLDGQPLIWRNGVGWTANRFEDGRVETDTLSASSTLVYLADIGGGDYLLTVGGLYTRVDRTSERSTVTPFGEVTVRLTQELADPWSVQAGMAYRFTPRLTAGYGLVQNLGGETSHLLRLSYKP